MLHDAIDNLEKEISDTLGILCTVHMDPIVTDDERVNDLRTKTLGCVRKIDKTLSIHDFRFVEGRTHCNLIFDISAPFELKMSDEEIKREVSTKLSELNSAYFAVITVDRQ